MRGVGEGVDGMGVTGLGVVPISQSGYPVEIVDNGETTSCSIFITIYLNNLPDSQRSEK